MTYYPQFPVYAYPIPYPSQEYYALYPHTDHTGAFYYDPLCPMPPQLPVIPHAMPCSSSPTANVLMPQFTTAQMQGATDQQTLMRKESTDSGISDMSITSRKVSTLSNSSIKEESILELETAKEEVQEEPYEVPDDEMCEKIVVQVEFYFSDANITKDKFLLKHVKRNKEGFVSLKLISSFKRVRHLTKDWRQVAEAIERKSHKLGVNDLKTKVRRLQDLPQYDETTPSRTVVAMNLPMERPTIEAVAELFSVCGDIVLIRILRPGNPIPADIKPFVNKHPEMTAKVCALVEYEKTEFAHLAVRDLTKGEAEDGSGKMAVIELTAPPATKASKSRDDRRKQMGGTKAAPPQRRYSHAGFEKPFTYFGNNSCATAGASEPIPRRRVSLMHNMKFTSINEESDRHGHGNSKGDSGLNPNAPMFHTQLQRRSARAAGSMLLQGMNAMHHGFGCSSITMAPQWMNKRMSSANSASGLTIPSNVIRLPKGPEKGKDFKNWSNSRMVATAMPAPKDGAAAAIALSISHDIIDTVVQGEVISGNDLSASEPADNSRHDDAFVPHLGEVEFAVASRVAARHCKEDGKCR